MRQLRRKQASDGAHDDFLGIGVRAQCPRARPDHERSILDLQRYRPSAQLLLLHLLAEAVHNLVQFGRQLGLRVLRAKGTLHANALPPHALSGFRHALASDACASTWAGPHHQRTGTWAAAVVEGARARVRAQHARRTKARAQEEVEGQGGVQAVELVQVGQNVAAALDAKHCFEHPLRHLPDAADLPHGQRRNELHHRLAVAGQHVLPVGLVDVGADLRAPRRPSTRRKGRHETTKRASAGHRLARRERGVTLASMRLGATPALHVRPVRWCTRSRSSRASAAAPTPRRWHASVMLR
eukprot:scaffold1824_cov332-Prasinococcus_capsulatus_cf.AAC.2